MKTPKELQSMSEKAAEFLGYIFDDEIDRWIPPREIKNEFIPRATAIAPKSLHHLFFSMTISAPILMHLAKKEMEKRGFEIVQRTPSKSYRYYSVHIGNRPGVNLEAISEEQDENEFISFWTALLTAIGGEGE